MPAMNEITNASRPENAPASVAPPQKSAMRVCSMSRGYHIDRLRARRCELGVRRRGGVGHVLPACAREDARLHGAERDAHADELGVVGDEALEGSTLYVRSI